VDVFEWLVKLKLVISGYCTSKRFFGYLGESGNIRTTVRRNNLQVKPVRVSFPLAPHCNNRNNRRRRQRKGVLLTQATCTAHRVLTMRRYSQLTTVLLSVVAITSTHPPTADARRPIPRNFFSPIQSLQQPSFLSSRRKHSPLLSRITLIRGGDFDSDDEYDDFDDDFDFDGDDGMFDFDAAEDDFGDESTLAQIQDAYKKTPPLTKAYLTASFGAALLGYVTNKNDFPSILQLDWKPTVTRLQLWRPLTAFLNFGPLGLGYLMTVHFVWTYMSTLERLNHNTPYDFWLMMLFGSVMMVAGYSMLGLSPRFLGHNLSTFLVYVWSRYHEGLEVNMFELFNTRAELLPWFFLAQVRTSVQHMCTASCWLLTLTLLTNRFLC
jgi:Derlin-2/3